MGNWDTEIMDAELSDREKALRDRFASEYIVDRQPIQAAIRIGYGRSFAEEQSKKFMGEPYTLNKIKELDEARLALSDEELNRQIKLNFWREAQDRGPGSTQASRVAALAHLKSMQGLDKPTKTENVNVNTDRKSVVTFYLPSNGRDVAHGT